MKRILSVLLVAVTLVGAIVGFIPTPTVHVFAAEAPTEGYVAATDSALSTSYKSFEDKIAKDPNLQKMLTVEAESGDTYTLYCNSYTGEVIYYNEATKEALSTNPYDVGGDEDVSDTVKAQLLSQVSVAYKGTDGARKVMYSFTEAAQRGQIQVKNIKNGIRVQYTLGRENPIFLMPGWITVARFEEEIKGPLDAAVEEIRTRLEASWSSDLQEALTWVEFYRNRVLACYGDPKDPNVFNTSNAMDKQLLAEMQAAFPITKEKDPETGKFYAIYTVAEDLSDVNKASIESLIRTYCPEYTYEDLDADNAMTGYVSKAEAQPLFKLSLEYTINLDDGSLDIRMPGNGILYDETLFQLETISALSYLGAGSMSTSTYGSYFRDSNQFSKSYAGSADKDAIVKDGYLFYPDGSGVLFEFSDLYTETKKPNVSWTTKVYGTDYAYYTVTGQSQEAIRLPVYGVVSTSRVDEVLLDSDARTYDLNPVKTGFVAILEEGEAMTSLAVSFGATMHKYASVYPVYTPRPKDSYEVKGSVSVSGNNEWTVVSDRRYTGNYRTRVILLSDTADATYPTSWVGMAAAYRDYLVNTGVLTEDTIAAVEEQIPLYIETFGAYETTKQILSMPVDVKVPLTSFDDVAGMYQDLKDNSGIYNINFKLTGFANGGIASKYPAKLKWEKAVGGKNGFRDLIALAENEGFGVYPEFEFSYLSNEGSFDGVSLKGLGARTVDNRYCSKQVYNAVYQQFESFFDICVATNLVDKYYSKFSDKLSAYQEDGSFGLSVGSLGSDLNSNFDEDNSVNREEAKEDVSNLLASMKSSYKSLMVNGGNSYSLRYADHILSMPLAGSNFRYASASVPFMAMVLHGRVNYTGSAINMAGDTEYTLLKLIENGAYPYFLLSYNSTNTMLLKNDEALSKYYSIRYDIWRWSDPDEKTGDGTIVEQYRKLNEALWDLQDAEMIDHSFIRGERVLKDSEAAANKLLLEEAVLTAVRNEIESQEVSTVAVLANGLKLYNAIAPYDQDILDAKAAAAGVEEDERTNIQSFLVGKADLRVFISDFNRVVEAYVTGNGLADLGVLRGLRVVVNSDIDSVWASVVAGVKGVFTESELLDLKVKVKAILDAGSDNSTLYADFKAALGATPADEDILLFNRMIYSAMSEAEILAAAEGFSVELDATEAAAIVALAQATRGAKHVLAVANSVEIDYNFNTTGSSATDGLDYVATDYTLNDERLVLVTYRKADGSLVKFILNYNIFAVTVKMDGVTYPVESYRWVRIDSDSN